MLSGGDWHGWFELVICKVAEMHSEPWKLSGHYIFRLLQTILFQSCYACCHVYFYPLILNPVLERPIAIVHAGYESHRRSHPFNGLQ